MRYVLLPLLLVALFAPSAFAQDAPRLSFPAACKIGEACWIFSFFDLDPGDSYIDHRCGVRTYAGHTGTDIATVDVTNEVAVLAASAGRVVGTRDGEVDHPAGGPVQFPPGKDCGNGVRIDHGNGWASQYCHLKRGSISVKPGQIVDAGTVLGAIGNSGNSETPHLDFTVSRNATKIDPFQGEAASRAQDCAGGKPLWDAEALDAFGNYAPVFIRHAGFADRPLKVTDAQALPAPNSLSRKASALVFYTTVYGVAKGTRFEWIVTTPDGKTFVQNTLVAEENRARRFDFNGRKTPDEGWPPGRYTGTVTVTSEGRTFSRSASVVLEQR